MREKNSIKIHSRGSILAVAGLCFLSAILAAGCGGEYLSQSGNHKNASSSAVSGDAIKSGKDPYESIYCSKDPMCNDRNYYKCTDKVIEQRTLKGRLLQTIPFGKYGVPIYVTEDEIFCITLTDPETNREKTQLWSIPIEKSPERDVLHTEQASFILEDETVGWGDYFYADTDQIVYINPYDFKVFDRRTGKYIKLKNNPKDQKGMPNDITYMEDCMCDGYILFQCKYDGLYVYELGSDRLTLVDEMAHGAYISTGYGKKHQIIYEHCDTCQPGKDARKAPDHTAALYIYDCLTGEKQLFMKDEQWKEAYKKSGIYEDNMEYLDGYDFSWKSFFIDGNMFYLVDQDLEDQGIVFSIDLEGGKKPHYERQLTEWLRKTGYEVTTFDHGRCYTLYENDSDEEYSSISGYYDLEKNEFVETERV